MIGRLICQAFHRGYSFDRIEDRRVQVTCAVCGRGFTATLPEERETARELNSLPDGVGEKTDVLPGPTQSDPSGRSQAQSPAGGSE